ncbi:MAG: anthranilate phosphoribosyltransferase [Candidatus Melainabacteria bacterium]|nr:anthranilate phosphoribosyltransferase [Candidatus Melainabacteria bacterium]
MISREQVTDIVNARLTDEELVEALKQLSTGAVTLEVLRMFIEETRATAEGKNDLPAGTGLIDVSGTGGSGIAHFNTSTFCAFVLAAGGVKVAKFGNRASRSGAGSADLLEALGIPLDLPAARVADVIARAGVAFLFAPHYYPGLKRLAPARKAAGQPTVFNHIGPLLNPISPEFRLLGIASEHVYPLIVQYLQESNSGQSLVVRSQFGIDELVPGSLNTASYVSGGTVQDLSFSVQGGPLFDGDSAKRIDLDLAHNVSVFNQLMDTRPNTDVQPWLDLVCLNAGAGFFVTGTVSSIDDGIIVARDLICGGRVKEKVDEVRRVYEKCAA